MKRSAFDRISKRIPDSTRKNISRSIDIALRIHEIMKKKNITQRMLAEKLEKNESEISKWLTGMHNFTIQSISKIEDVLGENIIEVIKEKTIKKKLDDANERLERIKSLSQKLSSDFLTRTSSEASLKINKFSTERDFILVDFKTAMALSEVFLQKIKGNISKEESGWVVEESSVKYKKQ